jgi:hypothetical protein
MGTKPKNLNVKTYDRSAGMGNTVFLGDYEISLEDFLLTAKYVLTNTNLEPNDQRLQFVKCVQSMKQVEGYSPGRKRLQASEPAILSTGS